MEESIQRRSTASISKCSLAARNTTFPTASTRSVELTAPRTMEFEAGEIQCSADHSLATAAFRGEDACYLVLTRTLRPSEQDTRTGLDEVHIELNDQLHSSYGGVAFGSLLPNRIELALNN